MYIRYLQLVQVFFIAILPYQLFFSYFCRFLITGVSSLYRDRLPIFSLLLLRLCSGDAVSKARGVAAYLGMYGFVEFFQGMLVEGMFFFTYDTHTIMLYKHTSIYKVFHIYAYTYYIYLYQVFDVPTFN